jgi:enterochelin esterase-like enzyme
LRAQGRIRKTLVEGIDSAGLDRSREYAPQLALERLAPEARRHGLGPEGAPLLGEAFLRFLVEELKPFVDGRYRTRPGRAHTHAMGSSLGGLVSLYALVRYPKVFGSAAALSLHWPIALGPGMLEPEPSPETLAMADAFLAWLEESLPRAGHHRLYFDHGDQTLDALYGPFQARMNEIARRKGYGARDYRAEGFPGASHDEAAWRARLAGPLAFLLSRKP